ncbi:glycosyltransferase family 2 protein [Patescibacteria group bacterium]|nr:glycosyltransferase family 2 protein [Patescibacteria group bacterium]
MSEKKINLSIIIVSFNTKKVLQKCLESLKSVLGELGAKTELILVDNQSQDGTTSWLKEYEQNQNPFEVKVFYNHQNVGFGRAVNQAAKISRGDWLLLLNSDIICQPEAILKMVGWAEKQPGVGAVGGRLLNLDLTPQPSVLRLPTLKRAVSEFWLDKEKTFAKYLPEKSGEVEAVVGAVMLLARTILKEGKIFDERYFMYFEDLDLCRRLGREGLKVYYTNQAEFLHYHGESGKGRPKTVARYLKRSSFLYYGLVKKVLIDLVIITGQKWRKIIKVN